MRSAKRRVVELERKQGNGVMVHHLYILYDGETAPEHNDPDTVKLIMHLDGPRPAEDSPHEKH